MDDRIAASAGFVAAGVALAAVLLPWPDGRLAVAGLSTVALVAFGLRRYGLADRSAAGAVAGLAGLALVAAAAGAFLLPVLSDRVVPWRGPAIAVVGGALVALLGYADRRAVPPARLASMARATAEATAVGLAGLLAIVVWLNLVAIVAAVVTPGGVTPTTRTALSTLAGGLGTATVAAVYLAWSGRGLAFVDLRRPGFRDAAYVGGGVVAIVGLNLGLGALFRRLGLETATHSIIRTAESTPEVLLVLVPLSYLVIAPGEELLYRNVVQKSLYDAFSRRGAIVVASAIFAAAHVFSYLSSDPLATLNGLVIVFALSLVLGVVYERTRSVIAPALVHGSFDAVAFAVTYVRLTGLF